MKKPQLKLLIVCFVMLFAVCLAFVIGVSAEGKTVYLSSTGNASADGTKGKPYGNIDDAIKAVSGGGTIVVMDKYTVESNGASLSVPTYTEPKHSGKIVFTSVDGSADYRASGAALHFSKKMTYQTSGEVLFEKISAQSDGVDVFIAANFNPIEFGEDFAAKNTKGTAKFLYAIGGYFSPMQKTLPADLDSNITIRSGDFRCIMGFAHVKGAMTYTFTGTANINIYGGSIGTAYGGSTLNHYSGNVNFKMWGGEIGTLCTAGDLARRVYGNANVELRGGKVGTLNINNVIGDVSLLLDSTVLSAVKVSYATDEIKGEAQGHELKVKYNSIFYPAALIASVKEFTSIERYGTIYVSDDGNGDGSAPDKATSDLSEAIKILSKGGGTIEIEGTVSVSDFTEPSHTESIEIVGGTLKIVGKYVMMGDTSFDDCTIEANGYIDANGKNLVFGKNVNVTGAPDVYVQKGNASASTSGAVVIHNGDFGNIYASNSGSDKSESSIELVGGSANKIEYCGGGASLSKSTVLVSGAQVKEIVSGNGVKVKTLAVELAANADKLDIDKADSLSLKLGKGSIGSIQIKTDKAVNTLSYDPKSVDSALVDPIKDKFSSVKAKKTVYVSNGEDGDGFSSLHPLSDLSAAFEALSEAGGEVVICGDVSVKEAVTLPACAGIVSISSQGSGVLKMGANVYFSSSVEIGNIKILTIENGTGFIFNGHKSVILENTEVELDFSIEQYPSLIAGSTSKTDFVSVTDLTVNSGKWRNLFGGSTVNGYYLNTDFKLTVNGGEFHGYTVCSGAGKQTGKTTAVLNNGVFYQNVYGTYTAAGTESYNGQISLTINDGVYYGKIRMGLNRASNFTGKYDVYINGGDFSHLSDIEGNDGFIGISTANIHFGDGVDINRSPEGTITYQNPVRKTADPRILLVDGMYYYVFTSGSTLAVYKAANITDLAHSRGELVWDAKQYADVLEGRTGNIWPNQIMYYPPEEFGEEYAGWYLYFSTYVPVEGTTDGDSRRGYVLKSKTSDLQGDWVNPVTGKIGVPEKFSSDTYEWVNNNHWFTGPRTFRYNGEVYALFVVQNDRQTPQFRQTAYLSKFKNPWTVTGTVLELINPEYDWERVGSGYDEANDLWYLGVIEGLTPVVSDDNTLYVMYAASGYWTTEYCLGKMTFLGGDIFDINNWVKNPTPIFSKNNEVNGVGGPTLCTLPDGTGLYMLYHGYLGSDTSSGRYLFIEPLTIDENGPHIGVNGHPSPLSTKFEIKINPTPLAKKISGFDNYTPPTEGEPPAVDQPIVDTSVDSGKPLDLTLVLIGSLAGIFVITGVAVLVILKSKKKKGENE